jgi:hypothetical protein
MSPRQLHQHAAPSWPVLLLFLRYHCPLLPMKNLTPSFWSSGASYETGWDTPNKAAG